MRDSLRARLLAWFTLSLAVVIASFGASVCYLLWRSAIASTDETLLTQARLVEQSVRPGAFDTFDLDLPEPLLRTFHEPGAERPYYAVWSAGGELIDQSDPEARARVHETLERWSRGTRREVARRGRDLTVVVGRDVSDIRRTVWSLAGSIAAVGVLALAVSLAGGWFLVGRALAPIARINATAGRMSAGDWSARVPIDRTESELGQLAAAINEAFDRLQETLERQRGFTADASHELRTPLAALSAEVEWALARERTPSEYRDSLETAWRAAGRMRAVVEALLTLARADAGELPLHAAPLAFDSIVDEVVTANDEAARARGVGLRHVRADVHVVGDPELLRTAVGNLVANAIAYNRDGGRVTLTVAEDDAGIRLDVADTGLGIPADDLPRIFERFYRADKARARRAGGAGLGLALAKWIVDAHGGRLTCASVVGEGTTFTLRLPRSRSSEGTSGTDSGPADGLAPAFPG
jgi:two-component system, OmpR family, sensor kinase